MALLEALPDEILERILGLLAPTFFTSKLPPSRFKGHNRKRDISLRPCSTPTDDERHCPYKDISNLALTSKRLNYLATPVLYQSMMLRISEVKDFHDELLRFIKGPSGSFVRALSIRDPDPTAYPRVITPNYRNKMIFTFSEFLVNLLDALSEHSLLTCFHWDVFDTLTAPPIFMNYLPSSIQDLHLDQGRVIPVNLYSNLKKIVYRAPMLSWTSHFTYEIRISRLLKNNFASLRFLQLQNVNLASCFEFQSQAVAAGVAKHDGPQGTSLLAPMLASVGVIVPSLQTISLSTISTSTSSPERFTTEYAEPDLENGSQLSNYLSPPSPASTTPMLNAALPTANSSVLIMTAAGSSPVSSIILPNLEVGIFSELFPTSFVSYQCAWLIELLRNHAKNRNLMISYSTRREGKDIIFAREWGILENSNELDGTLHSDEDAFRRQAWPKGKSGTWEEWDWEYSKSKGWKFKTALVNEF
ncbi:hypothetical protein V1514DRAFT_291346 [Lipomyces japonicus]|uniref:uncharacterized protein n=1 Tax=Lipomyces japonicus TaxID=56871 RepID=UPI0034CE0622